MKAVDVHLLTQDGFNKQRYTLRLYETRVFERLGTPTWAPNGPQEGLRTRLLGPKMGLNPVKPSKSHPRSTQDLLFFLKTVPNIKQ